MTKYKPKKVETDIRKVGSQSYRELLQLNQQKYQSGLDYAQRTYGVSGFTTPGITSHFLDIWEGDITSPIAIASNYEDYVGNSYWDRKNYTVDDLDLMQQNPNELRALDLPWYAQINNGIIKMSELAVSTFLNSTVGLIWGLGLGTYNSITGNNDGSFMRGLWDNSVTAGLDAVDKKFEDWAPNYYTLAENEAPWYENIFTSNFIGDKILKNTGFAAGAIAAAYVTKGLGVGSLIGKAFQALGAGARTARFAAGIANRVVNSIVSAAGEATKEAYNSVHDGMEMYERDLNRYYEENRLQLEEQRKADISNGMSEIEAWSKYNESLDKLNVDVNNAKNEYLKTSTDSGNAVFGMNMAILTISNNLQFGRAMKGGWGSLKLLERAYKEGSKDIARTIDGKIIGETMADDIAFGKALANNTAGYVNVAKQPTPRMFATSAVKNAISEGSEEGLQRLTSDTNQMRAYAIALKQSKNNGYIDYALNPEITDAMINYSDAINHAWLESFGTVGSSGWEEVALGALTGILGVPSVGKRKSGRTGITWQGGFFEDYKDAKENYERVDRIVQNMNKITDTSKLRRMFTRAVADVAINLAQRQALFEDDHFIFKNSQLAGVVNAVLGIRDGLDSSQIYKAMVEEMATNITDKDVEEYKQAAAVLSLNDNVFSGKTNDEIKQELQGNFLKLNVMLDRVLLNHDKLQKDEKAQQLSDLGFAELLYSYSLAENMEERIAKINEENTRLNPKNPVDKKQIEKNNKDLARLEEDKKVLNERINNALNNPEQFNKLVETKVLNNIKALETIMNKKQVEELQKATTMEQVAQILQPLSFELRESIIELAYEQASDNAKKAIDNYIKFQDDAYNVQYVINKTIDNLDKLNTDKATKKLRGIGRQNLDTLLDYLKTIYINKKRQERGEDLSSQQSEELNKADSRGLLSDIEFLRELLLDLQQKLSAAMSGQKIDNSNNLPNLINTLSLVIPIMEETSKNNGEINSAETGVTQLINALYNDIVFRDNVGENTSIADSIRLAIDTLERDNSLTPKMKRILLDALDSLKDNEKLQNVRNVIQKQKEKFKLKRKAEKENAQKSENKLQKVNKELTEANKSSITDLQQTDTSVTETLPQDAKTFTISELFDYIKQNYQLDLLPNSNLLSLGMSVIVSENDVVANETYPNYNTIYSTINKLESIKRPLLTKIFDGTFNDDDNKKKIIEEYQQHIKTVLEAIDKGFIIRDSVVPKLLEALNIALNDEMKQWYINYKGNDNVNVSNVGTKPDSSILQGEENYQQSASETQDMSGNQIHEYDMINTPHILHRLDFDELTEMYEDGIHPQWFVDNVLGELFAKNSNIRINYITAGKNNVYLAIKKDDIKQQLPKDDNISVVDTNDGQYVIIGTLGYMLDSNGNPINADSFYDIKNRLVERYTLNKNEDGSIKNRFYVDPRLHTEITNVTGGEFITTTDDENHEVYRTLRNLLEFANPRRLKVTDLSFVAIMGNEEDVVYVSDIINEKEDRLYRSTEALNTGGVYVYIPTGRNNEWIPIMLRSINWNDMLSQGLVERFKTSEFYKENILRYINTLLTSQDNVEKIKAIAEFRNNLIFNKHKLDTGITESLRYDSESGTTQYLNDEGKWTTISTVDEFLTALEKLNPRINISKTTLNTNPNLYIDSGILLTNVKVLSTMKSTFYVKGLDEDYNIIESERLQSEDLKMYPKNVKGILYLNKKTYYNKEDGIYDENGNKLDEDLAREIRELQSIIISGNEYTMNGRKYLISRDKLTVYLHANKSYTKLDDTSKRKVVDSYERDTELNQKLLNRDIADLKNNDIFAEETFQVGDTITIVNYDENGNEVHRGEAIIQKVFDNGSIEVENGVLYSAQMVNKFFGKVKPFIQGAYTAIEYNSRLGNAIPYQEKSEENNDENLDNSENNDNFVQILDTLKQYKGNIMDLDLIFENSEKLFGLTKEEAEELDPDEILQKLTQELVNKGYQLADLTTFNDILEAIDNIIHCK